MPEPNEEADPSNGRFKAGRGGSLKNNSIRRWRTSWDPVVGSKAVAWWFCCLMAGMGSGR